MMRKWFTLFTTAVMAALVTVTAQAVPMSYVEGTHYFPTAEKQPVSVDDGQVEVVEIFSYTCPHCFRLESEINPWKEKLPEGVKFVKVPAIFSESWKTLAKAYYAAEITGDLEMLHPKIFNAMQVERRNLLSDERMLDFVEEQGIDRDEFEKMMNSYAVQGKVKKAMAMSQTSGITGVPAIIVNGKYRTDASTAGGMDKLLDLTDWLIEQEQQ